MGSQSRGSKPGRTRKAGAVAAPRAGRTRPPAGPAAARRARAPRVRPDAGSPALRLDRIADAMPGVACVFRFAADGGTSVPYGSARLAKLFGLPARGLAKDATPLFATIHPGDRARVEELAAATQRSLEPRSGEWRVRHPDRGVIWIEGFWRPRREPDGGTIVHGFVHDITGRKRIEEDLRESEARYRGLFETIPDSVALYEVVRDDRGDIVDWTLVHGNRAFLETMHAGSLEELQGRTATDLIGRERVDQIRPAVRGMMESRAAGYLERRFQDREFISTLVPMGLDRFLTTARDITERKRAEEHQAWLASFPMRNPNPLVELDPDSGAVLYLNPAAAALFPDLAEQALAHPFLAGMPEVIERLRREPAVPVRREVGANRSYFAQVVNDVPEGGRVRVYAIDITEHKRAEQRLQQSRRLGEALHRLDEALHATLDPDVIMRLLVREGSAALGCETAAISVREQGQWRVRHVHGLPDALVGAQMSDDQERHAMLALETRGPVAIEDVLHDERVDRDHLRRHGIRAVLVAPLIVEDEPLGALYFNYHSAPRAFHEVEVDFAVRLATSAAVALQNSRLVAELRRAEAELRGTRDRAAAGLEAMTRLREIAALFVREGGLQPVFDRIVDAATAIARADLGALLLLDASTGDLRVAAHLGFDDARLAAPLLGAWAAALKRGERVIVEDLLRAPHSPSLAGAEGRGTADVRAVLAAPIVSRSGQPLGMVSTFFRTPHRPDDRTLHLLDLLAGQSADILDRAQAEARLHESEEKLRTIFEASPAAISVLGPDGAILDGNAAALALLGVTSQEEVLGRSGFGFVAPGDQHRIALAWKRLMTEGSVSDLELSVLRPDGGRADALLSAVLLRDPAGEPRSVLVILRDLTARHESELKYARILATALSGFWISDAQGRLLEVNDALCRMLGYSREELLTMSIADVEAAETPADVTRHITRVRERALDHFSTRHRRRDGSIIDVEVSVTWLDVGSGQLVVFANDITSRRRMEEDLRTSKDAAEVASRAKGAFLANISHEIRTPLNAILGYVQLLQRELPPDPRQARYLEVISRSGEHLLGLINDVLDVSRAEAGRVSLREQPFDLRALLRDIETMFRTRIEEKGLRFDITFSGESPPRIRGDEAKVRQVLVNLVGNAMKFTETGGIAVRARVSAAEDDIKAVIEVVDSGCGIASEDQEKVFEAFEQTRQGLQGGGTGLGLTICRQLARLMGGDVTLTSRPGQGSVFWFTFHATPVAEGETPGTPGARNAKLADALRGLPPELRARLRAALEGGYTDEVTALVEEAGEHDPEVGRALHRLAEGLRYEELLSLL